MKLFKGTTTFNKIVQLYGQGNDIDIIQGGSSAGKTFNLLPLIIHLAVTDATPTLTSIVTNSLPTLKKGALEDFRKLLRVMKVRYAEHLSNLTYTFANGSRIQFFGIDNEMKARGGRRERLFINEANRLSKEIAKQLIMRTSEKVWLDYNPTKEFWAHTDYLNKTDEQRSFKLDDGRVLTQSVGYLQVTYRDNEYCPIDAIKSIEANRYVTDGQGNYILDKNGDKVMTEWYRVFGLGETGTGEGLVYPNVHKFSDSDYLGDNLLVGYGLDWGMTDPTACVKVSIDVEKEAIYVQEMFSKPNMTTREIISALKRKGVQPNDLVICDNSEKRTMMDIKNQGGFYRMFAVTGKQKQNKLEGIRRIQNYKLYIHEFSSNLWSEILEYSFEKDKDGNIIDKLPDGHDHLLDAMKYICTSLFDRNRIKIK